jgi:hypothetical protein
MLPGLEGAAILMRRGMLVWIRSWQGGSAPRESVSRFKADSKPLPLDLQSTVVSLLSNMIFENHQRRRSYDDAHGKGYVYRIPTMGTLLMKTFYPMNDSYPKTVHLTEETRAKHVESIGRRRYASSFQAQS